MIYFIVISIVVLLGALLFLASYDMSLGVYVKSVCRIDGSDGGVVITFDDGPDPETTPEVLDVLKSRGAKAVFFLVGDRAEQNPDIVRRIVAEGHRIGIHTMHHGVGFTMSRTSVVESDLAECRALLKDITDIDTLIFRPPFGVTNPHIGAAVRRLGLTSVGWSIRSYDTRLADARERVAARIASQLEAGAIVLMHDNRAGAGELLGLVLDEIERRGFTTTTDI